MNQQWYGRKLDHIGKENLKTLLKISSRIDLSAAELNKLEKIYKICLEAKHTRIKFDNARVRAKKPLQIIYILICAAQLIQISGTVYFMTFLDNYMHYTIYLLKTKQEAAEKMKEYIQKTEAWWNLKIAKIRCDGKEYVYKYNTVNT